MTPARAALAAVVGAAAGAVCLVAAFSLHPAVTLDMERDLPPRVAFGFYPAEIAGPESFAWTSERAQLNLIELNRRADWRCRVVFRGGRPEGIAQPVVRLLIDGVEKASAKATNEYQTLEVIAPAAPGHRGLNLALLASPAFVPGPADPRSLGVQVDRLACAPTAGALTWPSRRSLVDAALITGLFALTFIGVGATLWSALGGSLAIGVVQAMALSAGTAPYGAYPDRARWLALWIGIALTAIVKLIELARRERLGQGARFAMTFSAGVLFVKVLGLLHPEKFVIDAVFHAHRLEWVMGGRYFFTQPMPNGVEFPYAIALYVLAAPWTMVARDHVALLRIFVCAAEVAAGALLYWTIVRNWSDRLAASAAVILFSVVPLTFVVLGNANLTNAFGQSTALVTMVMATTLTLNGRHALQVLALTTVASIALLAHVSTFALLFGALLSLAAFYWAIGGRTLRAAGVSVVVAAVAAAGIAVVVYYGHFVDVYRHLDRTAAEPAAAKAQVSAAIRLARGVAVTATDIGWPLLALAAAGFGRVLIERRRDRLTCALAAYGLTYLVFVLFGVMVPVGASFERYVAEFISRVDYATYPAAVVLGARATSWAWGRGLASRVGAVVLIGWAVGDAMAAWLAWFR